MDFIHRPFQPGDVIAAISTPPGEGGISIIRISGNGAIAIAEKIFSGPVSSYLSHTAHLGKVVDAEGRCVDQALLLLMRGPRSYTGEDTVELQCHGGMIASKKVLEVALRAGARAAMPGEFTLKAYMNGKIDLAQAESIQNLISAKNEQAFLAASKHLEGALSNKIKAFQRQLIRIGAIFEAWLDFPEEGLEFASEREILQELHGIKENMQILLDTFEDGKRVENGISLCIVGAPNAGKSSLMNALLEYDRAIVTPIAGTTRDLLREELIMGGMHFTLTDTAGIRQTNELIEQEGIKRSLAAMQEADVVLFVVDAANDRHEDARQLFDTLPQDRTIVVCNKIDLSMHGVAHRVFPSALKISAKEKLGLEALKKNIADLVWQKGVPAKDEVLISSVRHKEALTWAIHAIESVIFGLTQCISPEFLTADLRLALTELGTMIGTNVTEEILSSIFSQFCIGK